MADRPIQSASSRYKFADATQDSSGRQSLDDREPFRFQDRSDNLTFTTRTGDRWWHIAQRFYDGIADSAGLLYWVLCDYQNPPVLDPTLEIPAGTTVVVPSPTLVLTEILSIKIEVYQ